MINVDEATFAAFVNEALANIPRQLRTQLDNIDIAIATVNDEIPDLLGLYEGIPLTERGHDYAGVLPDRITIYQQPLQQICDTVYELIDEIAITVVHEIAHHFGIEDDQLQQWGWG